MIFRVALGLARNPAPEHRWRRVAVPVSAAVFMFLVLAGSSVVAMTLRGAERVEQRTALIASKPSPTDLDLLYGDDKWHGEQFLVVWIEPSGTGETILPPGMDGLPEPGQAVVSPALDREAASNRGLAGRYPDRIVLGSEGVYSEDELFAYVRIAEDRNLPGDLAGDLSGGTSAVRVSSFGSPFEDGIPFTLDPMSRTPSVGEVVGGVLGFLIVPGFIVLTVGLAAASGVRDGRFNTLRWIGASGLTLTALAVIETLVLAVPGLFATTVLWGVISPRLERVPLVGYDIVRGDLELPWSLLAVEFGACAVAAGVMAVVVATVMADRHRDGAARPRPGSGRAVLTPLRTLPLVLAFVLFAVSWPLRGPVGGMLNLAGIIATLVGLPLAFPIALRAVGTALARLEAVPASIAGRSLEWDPLRAARPFLGVAALLVVALAGSGYIAVASGDGTASALPSRSAQPVFVEWIDPHADDVPRLRETLDAGLVAPFGEGGHTHNGGHSHEGGHGDILSVGADCRQLAPYLSSMVCDPEMPYKLSAVAEQRLTEAMSMAAHGSDTEVRLVPPEDVPVDGRVFVMDDEALEGRVRDAAIRELPAAYVYSQSGSVMQASPLVSWIANGIAVAVVSLTLGYLVSLVDRFLSTQEHRRHLLNLGVSPRRLAALEAWRFAAPYGAVVAIGFCAGFTICVLLVGIFPDDALIPWRGIGLTLGITAVAGLVGTASVAFFGARSVRENPE